MKITFLGTGAADWHWDKHHDWEGFRRNASALIDGCLLIDPNGNVPEALDTFGKNAEEIRYILNTHRHGDHYQQSTVEALGHATLVSLSAGEETVLGPYRIRAVSANHATCSEAVHFLISDGHQCLYYGLDGAWLTYDAVDAIKKSEVDLAVLDATIGDVPGDYRIFEHNNLHMVLEMKQSLEKYVKRFCIIHMARTLHTSQTELEARMAPHGVTVAYDGLELEL
jgi:L-ascorbate metabolism protein UlaG (beta-lactamase superfamily)